MERGDISNLKTDDNIKNPSKEIKSTRTCCLCKTKKNKNCFIRLEVYVKSVPLKRFNVLYVIFC